MFIHRRAFIGGSVAFSLLASAFFCGCQRSETGNPASQKTPSGDEKSKSYETKESYRFGIYTTDAASTVMREINPLLKNLKEVIGMDVGIIIYPDYEKGIQGIVEGEVDFMRLGPASYVTARERNPDIQLLAMESKNGERSFDGVIAVHRDAPYKALADLKGERFAFGNKLSTIGRYLAQKELIEAGIRGADLAAFEYLDRHDKVGMSVGAKAFDAGSLKSSTFKSLVESGEPIRVLSTFKNVTKPWVARADLEPERTEALRKALFSVDLENLKDVAKDGFLSAEDGHYQAIRDAMKISQSF